MTTHRRDEAISFVSWTVHGRGGALHIRRPRSQKGVAYCDELVPTGTPTHSVGGLGQCRLVRDFTLAHPDRIPLEISLERDFARLCTKCARKFFNEVADENRSLRWGGVLVSVPIAWQVIYGRTGLRPKWAEDNRAEREARDPIPSPHEQEITREELAEEAAEEERAMIDAEAAEHAEDDSLERSGL